MATYYQCRFRRGDPETIAWIEERGAKIGALVELKTADAGTCADVDVRMAPLDHSLFDAPLGDKNKSMKAFAPRLYAHLIRACCRASRRDGREA